MKILFANKFFYLNGGSETVFFQERAFLLNQGHKVVDFSMADKRNFTSPYASHFIPNINYTEAGGLINKIKQAAAFIHSPVAVNNLELLIKKEKPQLAHLHNIYHQLTPSIIPVLKKHGIKVVLTLHDYKLVCPGYLALKNKEICNACSGKKFWKPLTTNCQNSYQQGMLLTIEAMFHQWQGSYKEVDLFIAPSAFMAEIISKRISPDKIKILHNGIDADIYQPQDEVKGYGLYFGRLSKEKGVTTLLGAHRKIATDLPLKIVGTGPLENELRTKYPKAEFLGHKTGQELNDLIAKASFVVVPSEWYENCSMVVLEAMAFGKPIIGSKIGGIPEQIEEGKTGFLFEMGNGAELADKMKLLAEDPELRKTMGKAARAKLEKEYSLEKHCDELLNIYNELIA